LHATFCNANADTLVQDTLVQFVGPTAASALAGIPLAHGGLYFPQAGWLNPPAICTRLLAHPNIQVHTQSDARELRRENNHWLVVDAAQQVLARAPVVVIASAYNALGFSQTAGLPIKSIRGQVSYLPANPLSRQLRTVLCSEGYLAPAVDDQHCAGATFNLRDERRELRTEDHQTNLDNLACHSAELAAAFAETAPETLNGRVAFRCATRDYLPLLGPAPKAEDFMEDYAPLRKNAKAGIAAAGSYWPGLYLNLGHGSRGLAYTPLCAELLAAQINNEPLPTTRDLALALNPARFIIRDLMRNKI
jgi:tRNA 5-methylaminomethyl-2-thiouridine biosynthesis bifunctional protein